MCIENSSLLMKKKTVDVMLHRVMFVLLRLMLMFITSHDIRISRFHIFINSIFVTFTLGRVTCFSPNSLHSFITFSTPSSC